MNKLTVMTGYSEWHNVLSSYYNISEIIFKVSSQEKISRVFLKGDHFTEIGMFDFDKLNGEVNVNIAQGTLSGPQFYDDIQREISKDELRIK